MTSTPQFHSKKAKVSVSSKAAAHENQQHDSRASSEEANRAVAENSLSSATPDSSQMQGLQHLLGDQAAGISPETLSKVVHADDLKKAIDMNLTPDDVEQAESELKAAAVSEGRDPAEVDRLVAVESLVAQERSLEDLSRNEPDFSAPGRSTSELDQEGPSSAKGPGSSDGPSAPDVDVEMELEMDMGGD